MITKGYTTAASCPDAHIVYLSEALALNAARLHEMIRPNCRNFQYFPCQDHWHVGHRTPEIAKRCREDEEHKAIEERAHRA